MPLDFRENPDAPLTVSQLTRRVKTALENNFSRVNVAGEITGWTKSASGHCYFALKDAGAKIDAVIWKSAVQKIGAAFRDGDFAVAAGALTVYEPRGNYQLIVNSLRLTGAGDARAKMLALLEKLRAEGLFAEARKRKLPRFPRVFGVVTSESGAALRDIIKILRKRFPPAEIRLSPCLVQGAGAPTEIIRALKLLDRDGGCDVILVGRGGGSAEDLAAFNDESVVRAVAACQTPIISSVGHEIDTTLCDFAADCRAATPSEAAEIAAPEIGSLRAALRNYAENLRLSSAVLLRRKREEIARAANLLQRNHPLARLRANQQRLDEAAKNLRSAIAKIYDAGDRRLQVLTARLDGLNPLAVLGRGFSIVRDARGGILHSPASVPAGERLQITLRDGEMFAVAE